LLQEKLFTGVYIGPTFGLITACVMNVMVALLWGWSMETAAFQRDTKDASKNKKPRQAAYSLLPHKLLLYTALCYVVAMTCSNEAIPYVSYPVAVLAKSCKLIPTMIVGQLMEHKSYSPMEWLAAICISLGIALFHSTQWNVHYKQQHGTSFGMALLFVSLLADGVLSSLQNAIKKCNSTNSAHIPPNARQTMLYVNVYALVFLIPLAIGNGQLQSTILNRLATDATLCQNLLLLNTAAALGQVFIFLTITWYTPVLCTTITTTRKFVTILLSVQQFGHVFTKLQWVAVGLVFCGLYTVIYVQQQKQQQKTRLQRHPVDEPSSSKQKSIKSD
jgi:UDP-galactose transporter B1